MQPHEIAHNFSDVGDGKARLSLFHLAVLGILAGLFIGVGANLYTVAVSVLGPSLGADIARIAGGAVFTIGLILVILAGAELFTGNNLMIIGMLEGRYPVRALLTNWTAVWTANFAGTGLFVLLMLGTGLWLGGVGPVAVKIAAYKATLDPTSAFFRGILCNFLVCLAIWLAAAAREPIWKMVAVVPPIVAFVASGFEHSVANMYFLSAGFAAAVQMGDPAGFTATQALFSNLIPVTLGNIIGGSMLVGLPYWVAYLSGRRPQDPRAPESLAFDPWPESYRAAREAGEELGRREFTRQ